MHVHQPRTVSLESDGEQVRAHALPFDRNGDHASSDRAQYAEGTGVGRLLDHDGVTTLKEGVKHQLDRLLGAVGDQDVFRLDSRPLIAHPGCE